ncbi:MAG: CxxxxCH/CxxCH domain-containing protein [bacterium]
MKRISFNPILFIACVPFILLMLAGCSELKDELPAPTAGQIAIHTDGWDQLASANFHGKALKLNSYKRDDCAACHSKQFTGGISGNSCYKCHNAYPHWINPAEPPDHRAYLKKYKWDIEQCDDCHGSNYSGGTSGQSCFGCHKQYPHAVNYKSGHAPALVAASYPLNECKTCHGSTFQGGATVDVSCSKSGCHMDASGVAKSPEACNTCHGNFSAPANDLLSAAPPKSVAGGTSITERGVGAHQAHLVTTVLGKTVKCAECHTIPASLSAAGHLDASPQAEVVFNDTLARVRSAGIIPVPSYSGTSMTCNNSYCHGNWKIRKATSSYQYVFSDSVMVGANDSPVWTGGQAEAACGSCHGIPPKGHVAASLIICQGCHTGVVDEFGKIIDKSKHINGKINVFGQERAI